MTIVEITGGCCALGAQGTKPMIGFGDPMFAPNKSAAAAGQRTATVKIAATTRAYSDYWNVTEGGQIGNTGTFRGKPRRNGRACGRQYLRSAICANDLKAPRSRGRIRTTPDHLPHRYCQWQGRGGFCAQAVQGSELTR